MGHVFDATSKGIPLEKYSKEQQELARSLEKWKYWNINNKKTLFLYYIQFLKNSK